MANREDNKLEAYQQAYEAALKEEEIRLNLNIYRCTGGGVSWYRVDM